MKSFAALVLALFSLASVNGFSVSSSFAGSTMGVQSSNSAAMTMEYIRKSDLWGKLTTIHRLLGPGPSLTRNHVPLSLSLTASGMSKEQYQKLKAKEQATKGKNLGKVGITTFKSRSFADWQKAGGKNLFPVDPTKVKNAKELPYMQRPGGKADDSDLKKASPFANMFGKKKEPEPEPEPEKSTNWWTLN